MKTRSPVWCGTLAAVLAAMSLPMVGCNKKSSSSDPATTVGTGAGSGTTAVAGDLSIDNAVVLDAASLVIPGSINLIPPKGAAGSGLRLAAGDFDADETNTHLKEDMFDPVDKAVGILCFVAQTRGINFLNQGAYTAYVDGALCGMNDGNDSQQGAVSYETVTVQATQDDNKPPKIEMWIPNDKGDGGGIYAQLSIAEGPSDTNPLGVLKMRWNEGTGNGGYIETRKFANPDGDGRDRAELLFNNSEGGEGRTSSKKAFASVYVTAGAQPTDGYVSTSQDESGTDNGQQHSQSSNYAAAFNADFVARTGSVTNDGETKSADACLDRNAFINFVDRYNLYTKADGSRVELNSGKPGQCTVSGQTVQANFSYWGIWNSVAAKASELTSCKFVDYASGTRVETPVDIVTAPGKLVKYTRAQTTLGALKGVELNSWGQGGNTIIKWTGNSTGFQKIATETCDQNGCNRTAATGAVTASNPWDNSINFYAPTLDANMGIRLADASDEFVIYYFTRETVSGTASVPTGDLVCYNNCPKMTPTAQEMEWRGGSDASTSAYHTTTITFGGGQTQSSTQAQNLSGSPLATYTFDNTNLVLKEGSTAFTLPTGDNQNANIMSGALVPAADFAALTNTQRSQSSGWDIERLMSSFYRWESGLSSWSQFAGVKQDGSFVHFDKPIELSYNFAEADNINSSYGSDYYGAPVRLSYGGVGNLWGIPQEKNSRAAKFSLKAGVEIGEYKVKPVQVSQSMSAAATESCATLASDRAPNLDSLPAITPPDAVDAPTGDLPLRAIGGELVNP